MYTDNGAVAVNGLLVSDMDEDYIKKKLGPPLIEAVIQVAIRRPQDPITFISKYLRQAKDSRLSTPLVSYGYGSWVKDTCYT